MAGIVTETKRRLLIGKDIKEVQVPTNTLDTSLYLSDLASVGATFNSSRIASELGALPAVVKQNASLALIADTYKTGAVYAINGDTKSLEELNFERGSSATYEDANGNIVLASANVPRINYRNGVLQGWLVEPASTNLFLDSGVAKGLDSLQVKSSVGLSAGSSGFNLGSLLTNSVTIARDSSVTTYAYKKPNVALVAGKLYTFSFFCRLSDGSAPTIDDMRVLSPGEAHDTFNFVHYGNGVYRYIITFSSYESPSYDWATPSLGVYKLSLFSDKSITVSGFQLEEGSYATSYIPTTTAIATRLADKISTKRPTVVFNKNSMYVKTSEYPDVWFGNGVDGLNISGRNYASLSNIKEYVGGMLEKPVSYTVDGSKVTATNQPTDSSVIGFKIPTKGNKSICISFKSDTLNTAVTYRRYFGENGVALSEQIFGEMSKNGNIFRLKIDGTSVPAGSAYFNIGLGNTSISNYSVYDISIVYSDDFVDYKPAPEDYIKINDNGNIEISYTEPIHIQQFALISRELSQEEVG